MEQLFEATTDAVVFIDREWRFTFFNRREKELVGDKIDLVGTNIFDAFPGGGLRRLTVPETLHALDERAPFSASSC